MAALLSTLLLSAAVAWLAPAPIAPRAPLPRVPPPRAICDGTAHSGVAAFTAAFGASVVATIALHPVDTFKTRQQHHVIGGDEVSIWRGVSANVLKEAPDAAVFLALSETLSQSLAYHSPWFATHVTMTLLLAGAVGDAVGSIFRLPAEVLCKRLQTNSGIGWHEALSGTSPKHWLHTWEAILYRDVRRRARPPHRARARGIPTRRVAAPALLLGLPTRCSPAPTTPPAGAIWRAAHRI